MPFSGFYVCAACKPRAVAKIARGEPVGWIWRDRMRLVTLRNGLFPDRCVRCNEPAQGIGVKRQFHWHHPALYLLLIVPPFSLLLYFIVGLIVLKRSKSFVPLCAVHKRQRLRRLLICTGVFLAGVFGVVGSIVALKGDLAGGLGLASGVAILGSAIGAVVVSPILSPSRINRDYAFFKGAGLPFLAELPPWPEDGRS